ncbi:sulfite oxidase heme-binding subunit YedZ [Methylopila musalis]|uniref:Sulfite oxidase heme-binding subunit YedZ n=1 Tax=Methylopila musalis TaxID=1134781 RepID=A0ABW3Z787_9HYPH
MPLFTDRAGRFSPLLTLTLLGLTLPALWLAVRAAQGDFSGAGPAPDLGLPPAFGPGDAGAFGGAPGASPEGEKARPIYDAIHLSGDWAVRFLLLSLAITPFRRLWHWPKLHLTRRRIGLAALAYGALHLGLYVIDQQLDLWRVASEIAQRVYLTVGVVTLIGLIALGATSTDGAVARMGAKRWRALHRLAYPLAGLALLHFAMQSKLDAGEPILMWGLFLWAMGWRWLQAQGGERDIRLAPLLALAVVAAVGAALSETLWYAAASGVNPWRVLAANWAPQAYGVRPAGWVLLFGLAAAASSLIGARRRGPPRPVRAPQQAATVTPR